ncbi:MAG: amino acid adenylation domain-containing protein [Lachnospiraceae bacterium]|uniref:amino acid adenylation domain-containing protein n=1 Tax=uncultured Clostridium sp. TaxID=59620 RepID=UPI00272C77DF|nr:amino acid adenylation domain-containing protein [uncultured Clostridium sp.]MCI8751989.1 amino acid adenylation domain-containing protein [Lachnospiraceae bacterium]
MEFITDTFQPKINELDVYEIYKEFNKNEIENVHINIVEMLKSAFINFSDNISIIDNGVTVTYKELYIYANSVANFVWNLNLNNKYVLVRSNRDWKTIGIILGILLAGYTYVPIQVDIPIERLNAIQEQTKSNTILDSGMEFYKKGEFLQNVDIKENDTAYVIFTSGTTGKPKGVEIPQVSLAQTIQTTHYLFGINSFDVILGISQLTFDLSVFDLFATLTAGAKLVILEDNKNLALITECINKEKVTFINAVPSIVKLLLEYGKEIDPEYKKFKYLRGIVLSGDVVPKSTVDLILEKFPYTNLFIMGGPTEITVWSNYYLYNMQKHMYNYIPYGVSIGNKSMYIMKDERIVIEEEGEIVSGGYGLAKGYLGNEELNKEKFAIYPKIGRIYKTGDKGILTKDGLIEIKGRIDNQVKLNGYRIELEEIERCLNNIEGVYQSVTCVCKKPYADKLFAGIRLSGKKNVDEIKRELGQIIPEYSIPHEFIVLEKIPLSENNKVDRKQFLQMVTNKSL